MAIAQEYIELPLKDLPATSQTMKADGWRFVQLMGVRTDEGIDVVYSFMKDGLLRNYTVKAVKEMDTVPSITGEFFSAFVFENELHDLFNVYVENIVIDFGGNFYVTAAKAPMTIISPAQLAAREKARKAEEAKKAKLEAAKKANAAFAATHPNAEGVKKESSTVLVPEGDIVTSKLAGLDPERIALVRAELALIAKKGAAAATKAKTDAEADLQSKLEKLPPEKAERVRAAMEAKLARIQEEAEQAITNAKQAIAEAKKAEAAAQELKDAKLAKLEAKLAALPAEKAQKLKDAMAAQEMKEKADAAALAAEIAGNASETNETNGKEGE